MKGVTDFITLLQLSCASVALWCLGPSDSDGATPTPPTPTAQASGTSQGEVPCLMHCIGVFVSYSMV